jgi:hypothetical protein
MLTEPNQTLNTTRLYTAVGRGEMSCRVERERAQIHD